MSRVKLLWLFLGVLLLSNTAFAAKLSPSSDDQRVFLLESAFAPSSARAVAILWAKSAKSRNGAVQYMLMCPTLQNKYLSSIKSLNWVTGVSSPKISNYKILSERKTAAASLLAIQYIFSMGNKEVGDDTDTLTIVRTNTQTNSSQRFCISQFNYLSPVDGLS